MRKFKLKNAEGTELDITTQDIFYHLPYGLGFDRDIRTVQAGYDFIIIKDELKQKAPAGEMVFSSYEKYQEFVRFCAKTPLVLGYMPIEEWGYIDCKILGLGKSELDRESGRLICPISFLGLSAWYKSIRSFTVQGGTGGGKTYPYTYPYSYLDTAVGSVELYNDGLDDSPSKLHIFGPVTNPSWALIVGGETMLNGKVDATIGTGNKLVVDSSPKSIEIAEYTTANVFVRNLYNYGDFGTNRFILVPNGESLISFAHEGPETLTATVEVKQLADTF